MKFTKFAKLLILSIAVVFAWSSGAMAGGGPGADNCWLTDNPGGGALALKATIAVVFTPVPDPSCVPIPNVQDCPGNVDAVLRVQRGSDQVFYRINIAANLNGDSDEIIGNKLLNSCIYSPGTPNSDKVDALVNEITAHFFGAAPGMMEFVITSRSISDTDYNGDETVRAIPTEGIGPYTGRAASIADLTLYAVEKLP